MLIGVYQKRNPSEEMFSSLYDPMACIKKIKSVDRYFSLLAYANYCFLIQKDDTIKITEQVIKAYPTRVEGILMLWDITYKGAFRSSEINYKTSSKSYSQLSNETIDSEY